MTSRSLSSFPIRFGDKYDLKQMRDLERHLSRMTSEMQRIMQVLSGGDAAQVLTKGSTNDYDATWAVVGGGTGDITDGENLGAGAEVFAQKDGQNLQFRTLTGTGNVTISVSDGEINFDVSGSGTGQVNSVVGTTDQIDVDSTDPANPIVSLAPATLAILALATTALQPGDIGVSVQAYSAVLDAYAGGDMPSAFTLSIVDAADGDAWRAAIGAGAAYTPAALTKVDDTNVTLTLGGAPSTALLQATSLTLGWTGTLAETRGGTAQSAWSTGDLLYASAANTLSRRGIGSTGDVLTVSGLGVPVWSPAVSTGSANPTASVGLSAVNGVATTYMRSDAAPALDQGIVPTWTGTHTWTDNDKVQLGTGGDLALYHDGTNSIIDSLTGELRIQPVSHVRIDHDWNNHTRVIVRNLDTGGAAAVQYALDAGETWGVGLVMVGAGYSGPYLPNMPSGAGAALYTSGTGGFSGGHLCLGTSDLGWFVMAPDGIMSLYEDLLANPGSSGSPGIAFVGDADTGMYRSAANVLGFAAGAKVGLTMSGTQNEYGNSTDYPLHLHWGWGRYIGNAGEHAAISLTPDAGGTGSIALRCFLSTGNFQIIEGIEGGGGDTLFALARRANVSAAEETNLFMYYKNLDAVVNVKVGASDSGGAGYRMLRITNT